MKTLSLIYKYLFLGLVLNITTCVAKEPKITIIMVTDQFAYHYIPKLKKHFKHAYKFLLENGINYQEAHHPHGIPETAPGHNSLSTATLPKVHGVVCNSWFDNHGCYFHYSGGNDPKSTILNRDNAAHAESVSPELTETDGLSDTFTLASTKAKKQYVYSVSIKDRAAVGTANRLGKALWFDTNTGNFTSSKYYFKTIPEWLTAFNKKNNLAAKKSVAWKSMYDKKNKAYAFPFIHDRDHAAYDFGLCQNSNIPIDHTKKDPYELFVKTPEADKLLFSLATTVLENTCKPRSPDRMILWICLSSLDLLAHYYGPDSFEVTDFLYHQDKNMQTFMDTVSKRYGKKNVLFVFTSDHGIQPIQEISFKKGITSARRIMSQPIQEKMNALIHEKYGISQIVQNFESSSFFLNHALLANIDPQTTHQIKNDLTHYLRTIEGIKTAWTREELEQTHFEPHDLEQFYKNQIYRNRSGDIIVMPQPYCLITNYPKGCTHNTPYDYDTHVPLILYQSGSLEKKQILQKVWIPQLAITLAKILGVQHPAASTFELLPGIFNAEHVYE